MLQSEHGTAMQCIVVQYICAARSALWHICSLNMRMQFLAWTRTKYQCYSKPHPGILSCMLQEAAESFPGENR
jgi:hypothetical protein